MNSQVERCKIKNTKLQELAKSSDKSTASEFRDLKKGSINLFFSYLLRLHVSALRCIVEDGWVDGLLPYVSIMYIYFSQYLGLTKDLKNAEKDLKGLKNAVEMVSLDVMLRHSWVYLVHDSDMNNNLFHHCRLRREGTSFLKSITVS